MPSSSNVPIGLELLSGALTVEVVEVSDKGMVLSNNVDVGVDGER